MSLLFFAMLFSRGRFQNFTRWDTVGEDSVQRRISGGGLSAIAVCQVTAGQYEVLRLAHTELQGALLGVFPVVLRRCLGAFPPSLAPSSSYCLPVPSFPKNENRQVFLFPLALSRTRANGYGGAQNEGPPLASASLGRMGNDGK